MLCDIEHCCLQEPVKLPLGTWLSLETSCDLNMFSNEQEIFGDGIEESVWQKAQPLTLCFKFHEEVRKIFSDETKNTSGEHLQHPQQNMSCSVIKSFLDA